jgi:ATP-dependent DNA helicase DinG
MRDLILAEFPLKTPPRPQQIDTIEEVLKAFEGGADNVIVEAPTGAGKTAMIITVARIMTKTYDEHREAAIRSALSNEPMLKEHVLEAMTKFGPHQAHMITSMRMLQDQYLKDDSLITLMKGKSNYDCHNSKVIVPWRDTPSCEDVEDAKGHICSKTKCSYLQARWEAQFARCTLHNFDSFIWQAAMGGSFAPRKLLTVDEAHGAGERIISAIAFDVTDRMFERIGIPYDPPGDIKDGIDAWIRAKAALITAYLSARSQRAASMADAARKAAAAGHILKVTDLELEVIKSKKDVRRAESLLKKINRYVEADREKCPWAVEEDRGTIKFEPVLSSMFAKSTMTGFGEKRLFMSATILANGTPLMWDLNLSRAKTVYIAVKSTFPAARRQLVATNTVNLGKHHYEANRSKMFDKIKVILDRHQGVRGVIHCQSYQMAKDTRDFLDSERLLFHEQNDRDEVVKKFMSNSAADAVLVGVFLKEGFDFKYDMCRFQIIPKVPYPTPTMRMQMREEIANKQGYRYYDWKTCLGLVQTYGRGMRSEDDECITYVLDNRLIKFLTKARTLLPEWFLEAVVQEQK